VAAAVAAAAAAAAPGGASRELQPQHEALRGRGLHSSTSQLNVSTFCRLGGASRGYFGEV